MDVLRLELHAVGAFHAVDHLEGARHDEPRALILARAADDSTTGDAGTHREQAGDRPMILARPVAVPVVERAAPEIGGAYHDELTVDAGLLGLLHQKVHP